VNGGSSSPRATGSRTSPPGEARRLASLRRLALVGADPEHELDDVTDLAVRLYGASYAAITFVDADHVWAKAVDHGSDRWVVPRDGAPAQLAIASTEGFVSVPVSGTAAGDAAAPPSHGGPPAVRQVAAVALLAPDGERVGAIELGWDTPCELDDRAVRGLRRLALHVGRMLELRAEADEYRRFIELHPDAVTVLDLDGAIELANPALAQLLGVGHPSELIGRDFLDLVAPVDRARATAELSRLLLAHRRTSHLDLVLRHADGRPLVCAISAGHLHSSRRSLQLVIRDLEERLRAERERARLSEQLAQAQRLDLAGQLAGGLAHDLNNLVTVMTSHLDLAEVAADELVTSTSGRAQDLLGDLEQVRRAVGRAGQLTAKLLQFARNEEAGEEEVDVAEAVDAVRRLAEPALRDGIELVTEVAADLPAIRADRVHLEQAIVNLVMNAGDALPAGGVIRLAVDRRAPDPEDEAGLALDPVRDHLCIEVGDDGTGMDDETLTRAFEPLFSTKPAGKGTGLGLTTVLAFVQQVGGVVDLRSSPGEGTTVWMVVPVAAGTAPAGPPDRALLVAGARVVVVDPNERARGVLRRILQGAGYRVTAVGVGEEALEVLRDAGGDALVTEAVLPGMPGWRTVEQARAEIAGLPALILTSTQAPTHVDGVRTLTKPFGGDRLLRAVGELLAPR
jgi:two-component system, cell cycle sensor histidine kinase and response regulator CckA